MASGEERFIAFRAALKKKGLKTTSQRDDIARTFFASSRHLSIDDLYGEVRGINPGVGYATVYRTMKLLKECEFAEEQHFADGHTRYENADVEEHHDHILCDECGQIVEFTDESIERLQEEIAESLGFVLLHHKMELYGVCAPCRAKKKEKV